MQDTGLSWKQRYDRMKKHYGWNDARVAELCDYSHGSLRTVVNRDEFPRVLKLAIHVFEIENGHNLGATVHQ
jgi:hypothetical protein